MMFQPMRGQTESPEALWPVTTISQSGPDLLFKDQLNSQHRTSVYCRQAEPQQTMYTPALARPATVSAQIQCSATAHFIVNSISMNNAGIALDKNSTEASRVE